MSRVFFAEALDTVASWWRIYRADGVALAFTTHDRDLWFEGHLHRAAPGLLPSAIRRTSELSDDEAEVSGALSHDTITEADLKAGRFADARIEMGLVDWDTLERASLYSGSIAETSQDGGGFSARLRSAKADLDVDVVPRTSPSCRARFCGPGCTLSPPRFTRRATVTSVDRDASSLRFSVADADKFVLGEIHWLDGPHCGQVMSIPAVTDGQFFPDRALSPDLLPGCRAFLREGCDKTIRTCSERFANAVNFQGEPDLPGNDLLAQYPQTK